MMLKATIRKAICVNYYLDGNELYFRATWMYWYIGHVYCDIADVYVNFVIYT